jgi:hypothetical protein
MSKSFLKSPGSKADRQISNFRDASLWVVVREL